VSAPASDSPFRLLPSVEELLRELAGDTHGAERELVALHVRDTLDAWRAEIREGKLARGDLEQALARGALAADVRARLDREARRGVVPAINATGVVLHTGLGRAPLHPEVASAMAAAARGYSVLELDRESGERNERDGRVSELAARLTGAQAAIAVNNNAGATYLVLSTFAWGGREVIVSRGELVEIGGSFRMPDVMARAGVTLREVGTTNRTRLADYRSAVGERSGLLLKVHTSNYRVEGFTAEVTPGELAALGRELGIATAFDLGSGLLETPSTHPLDALHDEPRVRAAVESGVDLVTFSGDKLLGGPQAGLIVGRREAVADVRRNPIYRALRLDKVTLAGLECTLELYLAGRADELPARRLLQLTAGELRPRAETLAEALRALGFTAEVIESTSQPGSGSAPGVFLPTFAVRVRQTGRSTEALATALRRGEPPVFARIQDDGLLLDPRTLLEGDAELLLGAFRALASKGNP
jgi:L-seryl-tRNA(Ser) seleniumtransferase